MFQGENAGVRKSQSGPPPRGFQGAGGRGAGFGRGFPFTMQPVLMLVECRTLSTAFLSHCRPPLRLASTAETSMDTQPELTSNAGRARWHEWLAVLAVVCVAVVPDVFNAVVSRLGWAAPAHSFGVIQAVVMVRALQVSAAVLAIVALSRIP